MNLEIEKTENWGIFIAQNILTAAHHVFIRAVHW